MDRTKFFSGDRASDLGRGGNARRRLAGIRPHRRRSVLGAVALAVLLVGTGPAAITSQMRAGGAAIAAPAPAIVPTGDAAYLPTSTVLFASVNPSIGGAQGTYLQQIEGIFKSEPGFSNVMKSLTGTKSASCVDVNKQVLSWITGSLTLALTSPSIFSSVSSTKPAGAAPPQGLAILLAIKPNISQPKVPGLLAQNHLGTAKAAGSYGGVEYYTVQITACGAKPDTSSPTFAAIVGHEGVVTPTVKDLKQEIDVMQGKAKSLASTAAYGSLLSVLPPTGLGYLYLDTAALVKVVAGSLSSTTGAAGAVPSVSGVNKDFGPFGAVLLAQANGFRVEAVQLLNVASKQQSSSVTPDKGATLLPKGTMFYLSIGNLQGVINTVLNALKAASSAKDAQTYDQVTALFSGVLAMLNGESALGILPMSTQDAAALAAGKISGLPLAGLFGVTDPKAAVSVVSGLLSLMTGSSSSTQKTAPGPRLSKLANGGMEYTYAAGYGYATLGQWLVASTAVKNVVASIQAILAHPGDSLAASSVYQQAAAGLPQHSSATAYMDISAIRTLLEGLMLGSASASDKAQYLQVQPLLLPLKALGTGTSAEDNGKTLRTDIFLLIGK